MARPANKSGSGPVSQGGTQPPVDGDRAPARKTVKVVSEPVGSAAGGDTTQSGRKTAASGRVPVPASGPDPFEEAQKAEPRKRRGPAPIAPPPVTAAPTRRTAKKTAPVVETPAPAKKAPARKTADKAVPPVIDMSEDVENVEPSASDLEQIVKMSNDRAALLKRIEKGVALLTELQTAVALIEEVTLPAIFSRIGMKNFTLESGEKIDIATELYPNVKAENKEKFFAWLVKNKFGDLIKAKVELPFNKGEEKRRHLLEELLVKKGYTNFKSTESVHPQTLGAFVREQLAKGTKLPKELDVHEKKKAKFIAPK